jgi:hypothetical protein
VLIARRDADLADPAQTLLDEAMMFPWNGWLRPINKAVDEETEAIWATKPN